MPIWDNVASGLGSIATSIIGNAGAKRRQQQADQNNIKFWQMQNAYNHPVEQMARLKQAGLNPALLYGGSASGASGSADKIAPSKAAPYDFKNPLNQLMSFQDVRLKNAQTDNVKATTEVQVQEALLKNADMIKRTAEGESARVKANLDKMLFNTSLETRKEILRQAQQQRIGHQLDNYLKDQTMKDRVMQETKRLQLLKSQISGQDYTNELRKLEKELKDKGLENSGPLMRFLYRYLQENGLKQILPNHPFIKF